MSTAGFAEVAAAATRVFGCDEAPAALQALGADLYQTGAAMQRLLGAKAQG